MSQGIRRSVLALSSLICIAPAVQAQEFSPLWAQGFSGTGAVSVNAIVVDNGGNSFVAGSFGGIVDFDPGPGTATLVSDTAFGKGTSFFARFDGQGNLVYVRQFEPSIEGIAIDGSGDLLLTGRFAGRRDLDPGTASFPLTSAGSSDIYLARFDASGVFRTAFGIGGPGMDHADAIAVDKSNNVYITGAFLGTADFDPGSGSTPLTANGSDIFVAKYSVSGALQYAFRLNGTGTGPEEGVALAVNSSGELLLNGRFLGSIDLDPGTNNVLLSSSGVDGFLARYDAGGNFLWGANYDGNAYAMNIDQSGNIWIAGTMPDSMDIDLGPGRRMLYSVRNFDVFLAKFDGAGNVLQARAFESNATYFPAAIATGSLGEAFLAGRFRDTVDFNPGGSGGQLFSTGMLSGYLTKFGPAAGFMSGFAVADRIEALATDQNGSLWVAGSFSGTIDLDPSNGMLNLVSTPNAGGFLARYKGSATGVAALQGQATADVPVYGSMGAVIVDFTQLQQVDARVTVYNTLGQTVAQVPHRQADMLRIDVAGAGSQVYLVRVELEGGQTRSKVWVR